MAASFKLRRVAVLCKDAQRRGAVASKPRLAGLVSFVGFAFGGISKGLGGLLYDCKEGSRFIAERLSKSPGTRAILRSARVSGK